MKVNTKNDKPDIKNKYYELGWFSTKIKEVKIVSLKDICDWISAMCELAEKGSKRQIWGTKKNDDRGMLGILNVCQRDNEFKKIKNLPNGIFDCVNLKNLLYEIEKCMQKTKIGRTHQKEFKENFKTCKNVTENTVNELKNVGEILTELYTECINTEESNFIQTLGEMLSVSKVCWNQISTLEYAMLMEELTQYLKVIYDNSEILVKPKNRADDKKLRGQLNLHIKRLYNMSSKWIDETPINKTIKSELKMVLGKLSMKLATGETKIKIEA